jgi:hypothetical protein
MNIVDSASYRLREYRVCKISSQRRCVGFPSHVNYLVWLNEGVWRIHHQAASSKSKLGTLIPCQVLSGMSYGFHEFVGVPAASQFDELL